MIEAFLIFLLLCGYTAFWVIRKRRYGAVKADLPSGPVKIYLSELIDQAEHLRLQLFGLLSAGSTQRILVQSDAHLSTHATHATQLALPTTGVDPDLSKKMIALEEKIADQAQALEGMAAEKSSLEKQLSEIKSGEGGSNVEAGASGAGSNQDDLLKRIKELEARLEEYSVIEDDLANLKRLQQENLLLKSTLDAKGIPIPSPSDAPPPPASPAAAAPTPESPAAVAEATSVEPVAEVPAESSTGVPAEPPAESPPVAAEEASPASDPGVEKSEADLVAEFEKMLKG